MKKIFLILIAFAVSYSYAEEKRVFVKASEIPELYKFDDFIQEKYRKLGYHERIMRQYLSPCQKEYKKNILDTMTENLKAQRHSTSCLYLKRRELGDNFVYELIAEEINKMCLHIENTLSALEKITCQQN